MNKKIISIFMCFLLVFTTTFGMSAVSASAEVITSFQQYDSRWSDVGYGSGTLSSSGCGVLSYVNAVFHLTGKIIQPKDLAWWSVHNGYRVNGVGTSHGLYKALANVYGDAYGYKYVGEVSTAGMSTDDMYEVLKNHLDAGGVAIGRVPGHLMAVVRYRSSDEKFLIVDSAASNERYTNRTGEIGWTWQTKDSCKKTEKLRFTKFILLNKTNDPTGVIAIKDGNYNPGSLQVGKSYSINGSISSVNKLKSVTVEVYNIYGEHKYYVPKYPNTKTYDIKNFDSQIKFGKLPAGTYVFKVTATDSKDYSETLVYNVFTVLPNVIQPKIEIGNGKYNPGTLKKGKSYSINGLISSNNKLKSVTVIVFHSYGAPTNYVITKYPNATTYNIKNVDSSIKFGKLSVGTYRLQITATDSTGYSKTLVNNTFTVK